MTTDNGSGKGGSNAAFFFYFFSVLLVGVVDTGKLFSARLGILRLAGFAGAALFLWRSRDRGTEAGLYGLTVSGFVLLSLGHAFSSVYFWVSMQHALNIALAAILLMWAFRVFRGDPESAWNGAFLSIAAIAALQFLVALYQRFFDGNLRPRGTFDNTNFLAEFMAVASILCLSRLLFKDERKEARLANAAGAFLFLGTALAFSASRAILVGIVPAVALLFLLRFGWRRGGAFLLVGGLPVLAVLGFRAATRFGSADPYNYARLVMWKSAARIFASHPFGVGLGGFKYYWFANQFPIEGAFMKYGKFATTAHSEFLEVLTGMGVAGLALFLPVLFLPLFRAYRGYHGVDAGKKHAAAGTVCGLVVSGLHATVDFNFHEIGLVVLDAILLGALLALLPDDASRFRLSIPPWLKRLALASAVLLFAGSTASMTGKIMEGMGEGSLKAGDVPKAERMFRAAMTADPYCDVYPDAMAALGQRVYAMGKKAGDTDVHRAEYLLTESIRWEANALSLCPMDFQKTSRLSSLMGELYGVSGKAGDLAASIDVAGRALRLNPFSAEMLWRRARLLFLSGQQAGAISDLVRAVSIEPNFCRGYAELAELARPADPGKASAWEEKEDACRKRAQALPLEAYEKWMVESPGE